jgi:hypothetical protein
VLCDKEFQSKRDHAKWCKECRPLGLKLKTKKYYDEHREQKIKRSIEYNKKNRDLINKREREGRRNPDFFYNLICIYCGIEFKSKKAGTKSCGSKTMVHRPNEKVKTITLKCDFCGENYEKSTSEHKRNIQNGYTGSFCSRLCFKQSRMVLLKCFHCGKEFERTSSRIYNARHSFCSVKCMNENLDHRIRGEKHYCYTNGKTCERRGRGWKKIREKVRERDGFTCQYCGVTEKEYGKKLDVHHIKPFREFSSSEEANDFKNLILLCPSCHHIEDNKVLKNSK